MKDLIVPAKLNEGDTVAFISVSGGRAGDKDMISRYLLGKRRFEKIFNVKVVETPNALKGSEYLYEHPEKRAEDLMWALKNDSVKGIVCNQGGDDSYRVFPILIRRSFMVIPTKYFPGPDMWEDSVIALEHESVYGNKSAGLHRLRAFAAAGAFDRAKAVITGPLDKESEETILKVICREVHRPDMVILENVDFIHRTPMTVLPTGALTEINCGVPKIEILEPGVS